MPMFIFTLRFELYFAHNEPAVQIFCVYGLIPVKSIFIGSI
jgi:hypothetical protein